MKHALLIILIATLTPALLQAGEVYRWTDESGNTHFSENPPSDVDATPMNVQTRSPETKGNDRAPAQEPDSQQEGDQESGEPDEAASEEEQRDQEAIERIRRRNCETAKEALKTLEQNARLQVEENGERRYLSPEEKEAKRKRYEKVRKENCD
ncbi:DUF4124 domain-containing protein [Halospina denitrificans]|nr:DUF4124 domain-containing protein [Halospina denitrificans]